MSHLNIEIKARCNDPAAIRRILHERGADFMGLDHQIDTYFQVPRGRLKLREGDIENSLISYSREDQKGPKKSHVSLYPVKDGPAMRDLLSRALDILVVVDKQREIYFIDNVKFHIDAVKDLGSFVEIEAIDREGTLGESFLHMQCEKYTALFGIRDEDRVAESYSDLLNSHDHHGP
jgi:predicted adenylyl cyclase CyaB